MPNKGRSVRAKNILLKLGILFFLGTSLGSAVLLISNSHYSFDLRSLAKLLEAGDSGEALTERQEENRAAKEAKEKTPQENTNSPLERVGKCPGATSTQQCFISQNRETGDLIYNWITYNKETGQYGTTSMTAQDIINTSGGTITNPNDITFTPSQNQNAPSNGTYTPVVPVSQNALDQVAQILQQAEADIITSYLTQEDCLKGGFTKSECEEIVTENNNTFNFRLQSQYSSYINNPFQFTQNAITEAYQECLSGGGSDPNCFDFANQIGANIPNLISAVESVINPPPQNAGDLVTECMKQEGSYSYKDCAATVDIATGGQFLSALLKPENVSYYQEMIQINNQLNQYLSGQNLNQNNGSIGTTLFMPIFLSPNIQSQTPLNIISSSTENYQLFLPIIFTLSPESFINALTQTPEVPSLIPTSILAAITPTYTGTQLPDTILNQFSYSSSYSLYPLPENLMEILGLTTPQQNLIPTLAPTLTNFPSPTLAVLQPTYAATNTPPAPLLTSTPLPPLSNITFSPTPTTSLINGSTTVGPLQYPLSLIAAAVMSETSNGTAPPATQALIAWMFLNRANYYSNNTVPYSTSTVFFLNALTEGQYNLFNNNGTLTPQQLGQALNDALKDCLNNSYACPKRSSQYQNTLNIVLDVYNQMLQGANDPTNGSFYFSSQGIDNRQGEPYFNNINDLYNWLTKNFEYLKSKDPSFSGFVTKPSCFNGECHVFVGGNQICATYGSCGNTRPGSLNPY